jgi:peptide/nickel transport system permease protein
MTALAFQRPSTDTLLGRALNGLLKSPKATIAAIVFLLLLLTAVFGPWLAPQDPYDLMQISIMDARLPPGSESMSGGIYWLGTDGQGRDMLSAMIYGLRTSLAVGVVSGVVALGVGTTLALMLLATIGQGVGKVMFALVLVQWALFARAVRSAALVEKGKEYVEAAACLDLSKARILFGHLLPNCLPPLIVIGTLQVANAISAEATLSFLGIGLPITEPSLGLLIANGYEVLMSGQYWISVYPGLLLVLLVFSINIVGDRLREVLNPRLER